MNAAKRIALARRVASDLWDGAYVNLGIGMPTEVANFVPEGIEVVYHSENGLLGIGPAPDTAHVDPDIINAGKHYVSLVPGAAIFDHATSFMMIRGGHIDIAVLGAYEVAANGDLANWSTGDDTRAPAVGGAMDLAVGARNVWVMMEHCSKEGAPRLLEACTYPLTAAACVNRIYTELAVIRIDNGFVVEDLADGVSLVDVQAKTGARLRPAGA